LTRQRSDKMAAWWSRKASTFRLCH